MKASLVLLALLLTAGCATMQSVADGKADGTPRTYAVSKEQAYDAALRILRSNPGFGQIEQDRASGYLMGAFNSSLGFLGVWVEPSDGTDTKVTAA